jgi:choline dehydrogenase-like flavoprotein
MSDPFDDVYDAIIVGSGAGGGTAAAALAAAGRRVLVLERGRPLGWADVGRDHLRNHRFPAYGHNTGPDLDGNPRVFVGHDGLPRVVRPHEGDYQNNAVVVGGGTVVYGAQAWRFMPQDFRMASLYGVPAGSGLADWPITYDDLEADYDRAEWEVGVSGSGSAMTLHGPRRRGYPMPPVPDNPQRALLGDAAGQLGWHTCPVPLLINSVPYNGRPACGRCGACVGFACPTDGKSGTQNTVLPRAVATGHCTLLTGAMVDRVETDGAGRVVGVGVFVGDGPRRVARGRAVVLSAGAIETARLLLNSRTDREPAGLGNGHDLVGRFLQGHGYPGANGLFDCDIADDAGPGVTIATCQFNHGNPGVIGGGMLANEFVKLPIIFWRGSFPPGQRRWGVSAKRYVRESFHRVAHVQGPVQEVPDPNARVTVDPAVRDRWGIPVARLSGGVHVESLRTAAFMQGKAAEWLRAAGAKQVWGHIPGSNVSGGQHQAGTARMADDPTRGVTDPHGRVFGHDNLFVADASLHVTNGGFNPVLTIMALGYRVGERVRQAL